MNLFDARNDFVAKSKMFPACNKSNSTYYYVRKFEIIKRRLQVFKIEFVYILHSHTIKSEVKKNFF